MPYTDVLVRASEDSNVRLARLNAELRDASAQTILRVALVREWADKITYLASFGTESAVMLSLLSDISPDFPVIFLDTGMHFPQTIAYRDQLIDRLGLTNVKNVEPNETEQKVLDPKNNLWRSDADSCCALRKVRPLEPALDGYEAWITGRKRFHGGARLSLPVFEYANGKYKVNPLISWNVEDIDRFFTSRKLPRHPLQAQGFMSVGCWPCSDVTNDPSDIRSGRWVNLNKSECGLHVDTVERPRAF